MSSNVDEIPVSNLEAGNVEYEGACKQFSDEQPQVECCAAHCAENVPSTCEEVAKQLEADDNVLDEKSAKNDTATSLGPTSVANPMNAKKPERRERERRTKKDLSSKNKRKEDKNPDQFMKFINGLKSTDEKIAALCKNYAELLEEKRTLQSSLKQSSQLNTQLQRERDHAQSEHSKAVLTRSRLESLCRELQRQYKIIKEESLQRVKEEEDKRKEVSSKFQTTLAEITNLMQENMQKNSVLREENLELAQKLKTLVEQYEIREQHIGSILKHKDLEMQLADAKLAQANIILSEEKEKHLREKQKLLEDLTDYQKKCHELSANEVQLRTQLNLYTDKYQEFQDTLTKNNKVFTSFRGEMEKMSKKIKKLEKEATSWKQRWENSSKALVEMAEDKQRRDLEIFTAQKSIVQLEKLCRALQADRAVLQTQLRTMTAAATHPASEIKQENLSGVKPESAMPNGQISTTCCSHSEQCSETDSPSSTSSEINNPDSTSIAPC